jgi:hypothetical protein
MTEMRRLLLQSRGTPLLDALSSVDVGDQVRSLALTDFRTVTVHRDQAAHMALERMGIQACCFGERIYLGSRVGRPGRPSLRDVLRHELVHVAQVQRAKRTGNISDRALIEAEAEKLGSLDNPLKVQEGACAEEIYSFWWLIPIAVAYVLLRPNVANAPERADSPTEKSVPVWQVGGEALALFAIPEGVFGGTAGLSIGRLTLGFWSRSALAGAASMASFRGAQDAGKGEFSGVQTYVSDAATGAIVGVVVPGGIKLIGSGITLPLDNLASYFMRQSDFALSEIIAQRAAVNPVTAEELTSIFATRGKTGEMAEWWLNRRGFIQVYRGQTAPTSSIISPMARANGMAASEELVAKMRNAGLTNEDIASLTGRYHDGAVPPDPSTPQLNNLPLGAAGIPTSRIPGVAADYGPGGLVYVIRLPKGSIFRVDPWQGLAVENEWVALNQIPRGAIVDAVPTSRLTSLVASERGGLVLGNGPAVSSLRNAVSPEVQEAIALINRTTSRLPHFGVPPLPKSKPAPPPVKPGSGKVTEDTFCMRPNSDTIDPVCTTTRRYTVTRGDSLWLLAKKFYGDPKKMDSIYNVNKAILGPDRKNPRLIPGQSLIIPQMP